MTNAWSFLQPWREALTGCLRLEPNGDVAHRGVLATFECWPDVLSQYQKFLTADKCFLRVEFPADPRARNNRQQLQRVREALELFDRLAAVDNAAFESLLSEFLIHRLPRRTGTPRRPYVVWPTWELQLRGPVSTGDVMEAQLAVTWGQLFGCPADPWETSTDFQAAMGTLQAMALGTGGNRHNFLVSLCWQVGGEQALVEGSQKLVSQMQRVRPKPFARELHKLLELKAPPVAHLVAVGQKTALLETWETPEKRVKTRVKSEETAALPALFLDRGLPHITAAVARTDMPTLKLVLADRGEEATGLADGRVDSGLFLSTLVCGHSLCAAAAPPFPALTRSGKIGAWEVQWSRSSGLRFGAVLSAFAEAKLTKKLTLSTAARDNGIYPDPVYWRWLVYALWSRSSRSCIQNLTISWINLTDAHVAAVKKVLASSFPEPAETQSTTPAVYGYVDVRKGTELRLSGLGAENDAALMLTEDYRCRASCSLNGVADVVVPGYGICKVALAENTKFVPDTLGFARTGSECGIRSLSLALSVVENNRVLPRLLKLVGKGLQILSLDSGSFDHRWSSLARRQIHDEQVSLSLSDVALACPELKELRMRDWSIVLGGKLEALRTWGIKKLSIRGSCEVDGLTSCLRNPNYRMSSELVELEISPTRIYRWSRLLCYDDAYVASLVVLDGEVLPVMKKKMPKNSKCAVISVVSGRAGKLQAVQYLDSCILSIIFAFAATPQSRSVQVAQYPAR